MKKSLDVPDRAIPYDYFDRFFGIEFFEFFFNKDSFIPANNQKILRKLNFKSAQKHTRQNFTFLIFNIKIYYVTRTCFSLPRLCLKFAHKLNR